MSPRNKDADSQPLNQYGFGFKMHSEITPGFTKYITDEKNANYNYIKGMFTEEEVKEAFSALDINRDGTVTSEDLALFLEQIGEKATEEEIEEMIRMCDVTGNGEVNYEEFLKMATGQSLAPIGLA